jgi:hypothetical protein
LFRIRERQLDFWADKSRREYVERISTWLEAAYPECVGEMKRDELTRWVMSVVEKCEGYGIVMERDVLQVILLFIVLGERADEEKPWVKEALADKGLMPKGRVKKLVTRAREEQIDGIEHVILKESA